MCLLCFTGKGAVFSDVANSLLTFAAVRYGCPLAVCCAVCVAGVVRGIAAASTLVADIAREVPAKCG